MGITLRDYLAGWVKSYTIPEADVEAVTNLILKDENLALIDWETSTNVVQERVLKAIDFFAIRNSMDYLTVKYPEQAYYFSNIFGLYSD